MNYRSFCKGEQKEVQNKQERKINLYKEKKENKCVIVQVK